MPAGAPHHVKDLLDVTEGHLLVEKVAHGIHEDPIRALPLQWQFQHVRLEREPEAVDVVPLSHGLQTFRQSLGVAVLAGRADLRASGYGIPSGIRPFDVRVAGHYAAPLFRYLLKMYSTILWPVAFGDAKKR